METNKYLTVSSLTNYIKYKFDSDKNLKHIFIKGEISNFKKHSSGHMYFSLKDEKSKINAIMFGANAKKINFVPTEGSKVLALGRVTVFESTGAYQIYIDEMIEDGVGNLYVAFEKLKEQLMKEGLFDPSRKKRIPKFPNRVGVITAPTGAAIRDIISTIRRRSRITEIIILPSLVQGEQAKDDLVKKIKMAENYNLDVLIIGRGGGSIEDLWPFNEEIVARAIAACKIPVISGTGHETDTTIADYVADLRAPTPTGAAEIAVPNLLEVSKYVDQFKIRIDKTISKKLEYNKLLLDKCKNSFVIKNPVIMYENKKQQIDIINEKLINILKFKLQKNANKFINIEQKVVYLNPLNKIDLKRKNIILIRESLDKSLKYKYEMNTKNYVNMKQRIIYLNPISKISLQKKNVLTIKENLEKKLKYNFDTSIKHFNNIVEKLEILNPISVLKRGYSIVYKEDKVVNSLNNIEINDKLKIKLHNGDLIVNVEEKNGE